MGMFLSLGTFCLTLLSLFQWYLPQRLLWGSFLTWLPRENDVRNLRLGRISEVITFLEWQLSNSAWEYTWWRRRKKTQKSKMGRKKTSVVYNTHTLTLQCCLQYVRLLISSKFVKRGECPLRKPCPNNNLDLIPSFSSHRQGNWRNTAITK